MKPANPVSFFGPLFSHFPQKTVLKIKDAYKTYEITNGFISVVGTTILVKDNEDEQNIALARKVTQEIFSLRPNVSEVDVSIYRTTNFKGLAGPLPVLTASIPRKLLWKFGKNFDRLWINPEKNSDLPDKLPVIDAFTTSKEESFGLLQHNTVKEIKHGDPNGKMIALTFDDAPHPLYTPLILDLLKRYKIKATFFCIGRNALAYPYFVRDMNNAGFEVANHTFHHVRLPKLTNEEIEDELVRTNLVLESLTGKKIKYFRPPGGETSEKVFEVASKLGLVMAGWTDAPADFKRSTTEIAYLLNENLQAGGIVLLHDNVLATMTVLPNFIKLVKSEGLELTAIGKLFS